VYGRNEEQSSACQQTRDGLTDDARQHLIRKARSVKLKKKTVKAYMTANLWMKDSFDLER